MLNLNVNTNNYETDTSSRSSQKGVVAEAKDLYNDIDKCIGDLVLARSINDQRGISDAHWKMETLLVNTQQVLSYIIDTLEVKEVDINKEISKFIDTNFEKATTGHKISLRRTARYFYELGLKAQKGE